MNINSFSKDVRLYISNHKILCTLSLGTAIVAYSAYNLGGRSIAWIKSCFGTTEKSKNIGENSIRSFSEEIEDAQQKVPSIANDEEFLKTLNETPKFASYQIALDEDSPYRGVVLTGVSIRPSNLFFNALFENNSITTMPGAGTFAFTDPHSDVRKFCKDKADAEPEGIVAISAVGVPAEIIFKRRQKAIAVNDLSEIYGDATYQISYPEVQNILDSQQIYLSSLLPKAFYQGLKKAMLKDNWVMLPGSDASPVLLKEIKGKGHVAKFLALVKKDPESYGFVSSHQFKKLQELTLYQIGSMVVKSEDFKVFVDGDGKIIERQADQNDSIRLINACGIRGIHSKKTPQSENLKIMRETFKSALVAADDGIVVFPAVGMGVWRGDPNLYWRAFLDAVVDFGDNFDVICVNPAHQVTQSGEFKGCKGEELETLIEEYLEKFDTDPQVIANLNKITNLFNDQKDVVQLARLLKLTYPDKTVSLFNASDPDVTLGYHVGEYVNNMPHTITTEENYTAMGTNGLCFEGITNVHKYPQRIIGK